MVGTFQSATVYDTSPCQMFEWFLSMFVFTYYRDVDFIVKIIISTNNHCFYISFVEYSNYSELIYTFKV